MKERGGELGLPEIHMRDGWLAADASTGERVLRFAMSRYGEIQLSVREAHNKQTSAYQITDYSLRRTAWLFAPALVRRALPT